MEFVLACRSCRPAIRDTVYPITNPPAHQHHQHLRIKVLNMLSGSRLRHLAELLGHQFSMAIRSLRLQRGCECCTQLLVRAKHEEQERPHSTCMHAGP